MNNKGQAAEQIIAEYYLQQYGNQAYKFDVILMDKAVAKSITWIKNTL